MENKAKGKKPVVFITAEDQKLANAAKQRKLPVKEPVVFITAEDQKLANAAKQRKLPVKATVDLNPETDR